MIWLWAAMQQLWHMEMNPMSSDHVFLIFFSLTFSKKTAIFYMRTCAFLYIRLMEAMSELLSGEFHRICQMKLMWTHPIKIKKMKFIFIIYSTSCSFKPVWLSSNTIEDIFKNVSVLFSSYNENHWGPCWLSLSKNLQDIFFCTVLLGTIPLN